MCIPLSAIEYPEMSKVNEVSESMEQVASDGSQIRIENSPATVTSESTSIVAISQCDDTPLRYRNLSKIYERCHLCIVDPECYDEATHDEAWKKAMENEMSMIKKNQT